MEIVLNGTQFYIKPIYQLIQFEDRPANKNAKDQRHEDHHEHYQKQKTAKKYSYYLVQDRSVINKLLTDDHPIFFPFHINPGTGNHLMPAIFAQINMYHLLPPFYIVNFFDRESLW
jgi:hypothetical protein